MVQLTFQLDAADLILEPASQILLKQPKADKEHEANREKPTQNDRRKPVHRCPSLVGEHIQVTGECDGRRHNHRPKPVPMFLRKASANCKGTRWACQDEVTGEEAAESWRASCVHSTFPEVTSAPAWIWHSLEPTGSGGQQVVSRTAREAKRAVLARDCCCRSLSAFAAGFRFLAEVVAAVVRLSRFFGGTWCARRLVWTFRAEAGHGE